MGAGATLPAQGAARGSGASRRWGRPGRGQPEDRGDPRAGGFIPEGRRHGPKTGARPRGRGVRPRRPGAWPQGRERGAESSRCRAEGREARHVGRLVVGPKAREARSPGRPVSDQSPETRREGRSMPTQGRAVSVRRAPMPTEERPVLVRRPRGAARRAVGVSPKAERCQAEEWPMSVRGRAILVRRSGRVRGIRRGEARAPHASSGRPLGRDISHAPPDTRRRPQLLVAAFQFDRKN